MSSTRDPYRRGDLQAQRSTRARDSNVTRTATTSKSTCQRTTPKSMEYVVSADESSPTSSRPWVSLAPRHPRRTPPRTLRAEVPGSRSPRMSTRRACANKKKTQILGCGFSGWWFLVLLFSTCSLPTTTYASPAQTYSHIQAPRAPPSRTPPRTPHTAHSRTPHTPETSAINSSQQTGHRKRSASLLFSKVPFYLSTMNGLYISVDSGSGKVRGVHTITADTVFEYSISNETNSVNLSDINGPTKNQIKIIVLKAKLTNRYLCINNKGDLVSYLRFTSDCYFRELPDKQSLNIVLVSNSHRGLPNPKSNPKRRWMVGFNRHGQPRKAYRVHRRHRGTRIAIQKLEVDYKANMSIKHITTTTVKPGGKKKPLKRTPEERRRHRERIKRNRKKRQRRLRKNKKRRRIRKLRKCIRNNGRSSQKCARYRSKSYKQRKRTKRPQDPATKHRARHRSRPIKPKTTNLSAAFVLGPVK